jgi:hypothetical protein
MPAKLPLSAAVALSLAVFGFALADTPKPADKAKPKHTNKLARESSPYLLMHAHNPVQWYPWGPEALDKAKKEKKLIFLSIGYSSCYWCHVMERQSFMNEDIAKILNEHFVCIKVDREERPDVDNIYMAALHVQGQRGGWPLSMFLTPDAKPIAGGTYWPPDDREIDGQKAFGFKSILKLVQEDWAKNAEGLQKHADTMAERVQQALKLASIPLVLAEMNREIVDEAVTELADHFDKQHGGFGNPDNSFRGPKFPSPSLPELLLAHYQRTKNEATLKMVTFTLDRMAERGLYDHLGGGFHRYTVEREWRIPHFEKMLYDNAQLVSLYSKAYEVTKKPAYQRVVKETLEFVHREMTSPDGAFYSALDAETDAEEGKFYIWTAAEVEAALNKEEAVLFKKVYGFDAGPNFEKKYNVLVLARPYDELAKELKLTEDELLAKLKPIKKKLFDVRAKRERPFLDTKVLTGWNGLMIAAYADAGRVFKNKEYVVRAERAARFVLTNLRKDGILMRSWAAVPNEKPQARIPGYLDDHAYLIHGLISLHLATGERDWQKEASDVTHRMVQEFQDTEGLGFFYTAHRHEKLFVRSKDQFDGATPSGSSMAAYCLVRLARITGSDTYKSWAARGMRAFLNTLKNEPRSMTLMQRALEEYLALPADKPVKPGDGLLRALRACVPSVLDLPAPGQPKPLMPVKLTAKAGPIAADRTQKITLVMEIDKPWHAYANDPGDENTTPTFVQVLADPKPDSVAIDYPKGSPYMGAGFDKPVFIYEGKVTIPITIKRAAVNGKPDASPLTLSVRYQVCDDKTCLPPRTVKVAVEGP